MIVLNVYETLENEEIVRVSCVNWTYGHQVI